MCGQTIPGGFQWAPASNRTGGVAKIEWLFYNLLRAMTLYSIGHSNTEISAFLDLLTRYSIELLVDTRSQPYSRYSPHFNREILKASLAEVAIAYLFMGEQLGGRPQAKEFYFDNGKVDYERVAGTPFYLSGIERLLALGAECRLAGQSPSCLMTAAFVRACARVVIARRGLV